MFISHLYFFCEALLVVPFAHFFIGFRFFSLLSFLSAFYDNLLSVICSNTHTLQPVAFHLVNDRSCYPTALHISWAIFFFGVVSYLEEDRKNIRFLLPFGILIY